MTRLAVFFTIVVVCTTQALAVPQPDAEAAYARGDYASAFKLWLPLAEGGSPRAQMNIARMYERGEWVAKDPAVAAEWYRRAAEQSAHDAALPQPAIDTAATAAQTQPLNRPTRVSYSPAYAPATVPPVTTGPLMPTQPTQPLNQPTRASNTQPAGPRPVVFLVATPAYAPAYGAAYAPALAPYRPPSAPTPAPIQHHHHHGGQRR